MEQDRQKPLRLLQLQKIHHHEVTGSVSNFKYAMKFETTSHLNISYDKYVAFRFFRICGQDSTDRRLAKFCNPDIGDEWTDGFNTDIKDVSGTTLQKLRQQGLA
jgi:hypothetical protein